MSLDLDALLRGMDDCPCGREHRCQLARVVLRPGALDALGTLAEGWSKVLLVADGNTWALCGPRAARQLGDRLADTLIYDAPGLLVPDEAAIAALEARITPDIDLVVGVGSGVINDLCKYGSFLHGIPYFIVATAPSMDGYASRHAALILGGMKITREAHMAHTLLGDITLLATAPDDMLRAGYGDILGKYSALCDWKLSAALLGEYFCPEVYRLMLEATRRVEPLGEALLRREPQALMTLMEAIVVVGVAMGYAGSSRPASGSEHHLSHFFEVTGLLGGTPYFLHGVDVAYAAVETQRLRERLLALDEPGCCVLPTVEQRETRLRRVYGSAAEGVLALGRRTGYYERDYAALLRDRWADVRAILAEPPAASVLLTRLEAVGLPMSRYEAEYPAGLRADALLWAKDLKERFTMLWLWYAVMGSRAMALRRTVDAVRAADAPGSLRFALVADTHLSDTGEDTRRNLRAADQALGYRFLLHLGDFLNGYNPPRLSARLYDEEAAAYAACLGTGRLFPVQGNHDGFRDETWYGQNVPDAKPDDWYDRRIRFVDSYPETVRPAGAPYYLADFPECRVRLIVLCSMDYTFQPEEKRMTMWMGFSQAQYRWFCREAVRAPEGWTLLVASHVPPLSVQLRDLSDEGTAAHRGADMVRVLSAINRRARVEIAGESMDFTRCGVTAAAWLFGHTHGDTARTVDGVLFVSTASQTAYIPQLWSLEYGAFPGPRTPGTPGEDCWDSAVLEPSRRRLTLVRHGAGEDRVLTY